MKKKCTILSKNGKVLLPQKSILTSSLSEYRPQFWHSQLWPQAENTEKVLLPPLSNIPSPQKKPQTTT